MQGLQGKSRKRFTSLSLMLGPLYKKPLCFTGMNDKLTTTCITEMYRPHNLYLFSIYTYYLYLDGILKNVFHLLL